MKYKGFTLLELLIVIAIVAIVATIAVPTYLHYFNKKQTQTTLMKINRLIQLGKSEAMKYHAPVTLCPSENQLTCDTTWAHHVILFLDIGGDHQLNPQDKLLKVITLPSQLTLTYRAFPTNRYLAISPTGLLNISNGTFIYRTEKPSCRLDKLIISKSGRTRMSQESC